MTNITIRSATFPNTYLRLDGRGVKKFNNSGSGRVNCQSYVGPYETLQLKEHSDGTFGICSATFEDVYLRLDAKGFKKSGGKGGGVANCQFGASDDEQFKFVDQPDGSKAIASVKWPGVYLRMDGTPIEVAGNDNGIGVVNGELSIGPWEKFIISDVTVPLTRSEIDTAIQKYGPILKIHPKEPYQPCSIEWYLTHCTLVDARTSDRTPKPEPNQLPQKFDGDKHYSLDVDLSAKPGDLSTAKAYVHAFWKPGMTVTDLQFWFFSAYNGPASAHIEGLAFGKTVHSGDPTLAPLGEHWADWEYITLRIDNKTKDLVAICLSQHGAGHWTSHSAIPSTYKFDSTHPIVYASLNGHANYPSVGPNYMQHHKFPSIPFGLDFNLRNETADGGATLDCSKNYQVVLADFLKEDAYPDVPWVRYAYRWGPEGTAINMAPNQVSEIMKAGFGDFADRIPGDELIQLVGALLPFFVKADINGALAPSQQKTWLGQY
ncbi:hypothetical protein FGG08_004385 [Glutinoglossum americanum]|uniref:Uncharacterized protein n=1 Tax=Glutinoglossum americanum TaxID=1670608 RepID=A0A9P8L3Z4_9PEZI|nr:hypothetical protein FGG08_004385 [Glutinoglossum americanum]